MMAKNEESSSPGWRASLFMQTTEDMARVVAAAASAVRSPRTSASFSPKENGSSQIQKIQRHMSRLLKSFSSHSEEKIGPYNPEVLTSQKRQWARFQLQYLGHKSLKEPTRLFESLVVVGLHPNCDIPAPGRQHITKNFEGSEKLPAAFNRQCHSRVGPSLEPQVLFVYPPEKQLPLKYKDLLSFCFPEGVEIKDLGLAISMEAGQKTES